MEFKAKLSKYLENLQTLRARNASEDQIRFSFLHFLEDAFPGLQFEELNLEQSVQITGHGSGAKIQHGFIDAVYGELIFEFKRALDETSQQKGESELAKYIANLPNSEGHFGLLTDGETVRAYALRNNYITPLDTFVLSDAQADDAQLRLDTYLFHAKGQTPNAKDIALRFGEKSPVFWASMRTLRNLWEKVKGDSDSRTKFIQWQNLLAVVYGSPIGDDDLFLRHTYLVFFARLMAFAAIQQHPPSLSEVKGILNGDTFQRIGFPDFIAEDFFAWLDNPKIHDEVTDWLNGVAVRLGTTYNLSKIDEDLLKALYQELVDPATRHDLGEFYTPDWLAELTLQESGYPLLDEKGKPFTDKRNSLFDPSCGSGTFIFTGVRRLRKVGLKGEKLIRFVQDHIAGLDVHPLAVIIAKSNLILALGEDLHHAREEIRLPIYMANALALAAETGIVSYIPVNVDTSALEQLTGKKRNMRLPDAFLLPFDKNVETGYFDEALEHLISYSRPELDPQTAEEGFTNVLNRLLPEEEQTRKAHLSQWYPNLRLMRWLLQEPETDGVWRYILQNATRPEFLKRRKFSFIVGNPPWLAYRYIQSKPYQDFIRKLIFEHGLAAKGSAHLFTQMEMATLFYAFMVWRYLASKGTLSFVMPRSVLTGAKQHLAFQKEYVRRAQLILDLKGVAPLFNVPTCVIISQHQDTPQNSLPSQKYSGDLPARNILWSTAKELLSKEDSEFNALTEIQHSVYLHKLLNGSNLYPRVFWFAKPPVDVKVMNYKHPQLETDPIVYTQGKSPWKELSVRGTAESKFLYATLLSDSLLPFGIKGFSLVVLPLEANRMITQDELLKKGFPEMAAWLKQVENLWDKYKKMDTELLPYVNWQKKITSQKPSGCYKVISNKSGTYITACVLNLTDTTKISIHGLSVQGFIADNTTFYLDTDSPEEAYYIAAYLNSPFIDETIKPYQSQGSFGAQSGGGERDICRRPFEVLPFPRFNAKNKKHLWLSQLGREAEQAAQTWLAGLSDKERSSPTGRLRSKLRAEAIAPNLKEIDKVVQEILKQPKEKPASEKQEGLF
jgi:hypothetical protein